MRRTPRLVAAATAAVLGVTLVPPASAAAPALRLLAKQPTGANLVTTVAAARDDVWLLGSHGNASPLAYRWKAGKWFRAALPRGLRGHFGEAAASSPGNVWAAASYYVDGPGSSSTLVRWDGRKWAAMKTWKDFLVTHVAPVSARDVWATGFDTRTSRFRTLRFDGRTWTTVKAPLQARLLSVQSAKDVWAVGDSPKGDRAALAHYDGKRWQTINLDNVLPREKGASAEFGGLTATKSGVWATGTFYGAKSQYSFLLRQSGRGWKAERVPGVLDPHNARPTPDLRGGGVTFLGWRRQQLSPWHESALLHRSASGRWTRQVPKVNGRHVELHGLTRLPGTPTLWSTGHVLKDGLSPLHAGLFSYGPTS